MSWKIRFPLQNHLLYHWTAWRLCSHEVYPKLRRVLSSNTTPSVTECSCKWEASLWSQIKNFPLRVTQIFLRQLLHFRLAEPHTFTFSHLFKISELSETLSYSWWGFSPTLTMWRENSSFDKTGFLQLTAAASNLFQVNPPSLCSQKLHRINVSCYSEM